MTSLPLALDSYATEWLNLLARWLHVIAAIAWIGSSFYFIALDYKLERPKDPADEAEGVGGEAWEVHGGGFYHVQKYRVAPPRLPERLLWFKWEAYTTWLSGFALYVVLYYLHADTYLVDKSVADLSTAAAVAISVGLMAVGLVVYEGICRLLGDRELLIAALLLGFVVLLAWGSSELFSARASYVQVGAVLGTMMAANVLFVIIPGHWELVRAKEAAGEPDPRWGIAGKVRSVHNNYLTLPVLFTMIGIHFPSLYGHEQGWLVLVGLMAVGAWLRHFFNLRHRGRNVWAIPVTGAAAIALIAVLIRPQGDGGPKQVSPAQLEAGKRVFASAGCGACHVLADAGATGKVGPDLDAAKPSRELVVDRVTNGQGAMPPFSGSLLKSQIEAVADYVSAATGR